MTVKNVSPPKRVRFIGDGTRPVNRVPKQVATVGKKKAPQMILVIGNGSVTSGTDNRDASGSRGAANAGRIKRDNGILGTFLRRNRRTYKRQVEVTTGTALLDTIDSEMV